MSAARRIVMLGTSSATRGGIGAVVRAYRSQGLFERWPIDYVETHRDGGAAAKALAAVTALVRFAGLAVRHRDAIVHVHCASRASFWRKSVFMSLALAARWPVIFHLHGGGFARFHDRECGPAGRRAIRFFLDRAAAIVVLSERWKSWIGGATSNPRIVCIPQPVEVPPRNEAARCGSLIAYTGRCVAEKGILDLVEALEALRARFPEARLECAGDGDLDAIRMRASALGIRDAVILPGWVGPRYCAHLYARAAVFVLPSHAEGLPMSLLEAMAAGCAVVASAVGGIPDLVADGENGLLVPPNDCVRLHQALESLLADPALRMRLGNAARATIERRFAAPAAVERLEQLYAGLGARRRRAPPRHVPARRLEETS